MIGRFRFSVIRRICSSVTTLNRHVTNSGPTLRHSRLRRYRYVRHFSEKQRTLRKGNSRLADVSDHHTQRRHRPFHSLTRSLHVPTPQDTPGSGLRWNCSSAGSSRARVARSPSQGGGPMRSSRSRVRNDLDRRALALRSLFCLTLTLSRSHSRYALRSFAR